METKGNKPSLGWAILSLVLPVAMILYGTLVVGVRPPVLPLIGAVALAGLMGLKTGYRWEELQEGMFEALGRIQIAIAILALVGMIIAAWLASGTIPAIIYWGLKLIAPEHFLLSAMVLCSVASIATGTSFGTMGTIGVALLGVGQALGYPPAMTVGAIVSGAYIGDKMSPVSDSTNITASVCEVPLFDHILSMLWTTVPAFVAAGIVYTVLGFSFAQEQTASLESLNAILSGLEGHFSLDFVAFIPPILMIALAYKRFPVLPVMVACLLSAVAIAVYEGVAFNDLAKMMTSGYVSKTGIKQLDPLLSRGGLLSIMPTVLLLCSGMAFGGILERSRVLEVLLDAVLKGARSAGGGLHHQFGHGQPDAGGHRARPRLPRLVQEGRHQPARAVAHLRGRRDHRLPAGAVERPRVLHRGRARRQRVRFRAVCIPELVRPHFLHPVRPDRLRHLAFERHAGSRLQKSLKRTTCLRSRM